MTKLLTRYLFICILAIAAESVFGQSAAPPTTAQIDPLQCWWRTSSAAIRVGEVFQVVLTCSVVETDALKVVPDQAPLDSNVIQMPPFEVTGGTHNADLHTAQHRFFQYSYNLRLISQDFFGKDVKIPELRISYRLQSRSNSGPGVEGNEKGYVLPALPVRVLSLVPAEAADIRDFSKSTFSDIDATSFRANLLTGVGVVLLVIAAILVVLALLRVRHLRQATEHKTRQGVTEASSLTAVRNELEAIARDRRLNGWSPDLVGRLLTSVRILASHALGRPVAQVAASGRDELRAGHVMMRYRQTLFGRPLNVLVAGSVTSGTIAAEIGQLSAESTAAHGRILGELESILSALTAIRYGRDSANGEDRLDSDLETALSAARVLYSEHTWLNRMRNGFRRATVQLGERVWMR